MRNVYLMAATLVGAASVSIQANAGAFVFSFGGSGTAGAVQLTYAVNPNTGVLPETSPNPVDPIGSYIVTGAAGTFSDSNIGVSSTVTGIVLSNPSNPESTNLFAPHSFGFYPIVNATPGLSYDDLFYPAGSPRTASDYPFHGGYLDIYGLVFTLADGDAVNLWSNGDMGTGVTYGVGVTDGVNLLDYVGNVAGPVPEPASWAIMLAGMGIVAAAMRGRIRARPA